MRIGIDFDNTIANYDHAFISLAINLGLIEKGTVASKMQLRTYLRAQAGGEDEWQRLQGQVYGAQMKRANLINGVGDFLQQARSCEDEVFIVSHKTQFGHFDPDRINLRDAAREWMKHHGFFNPDQYGLDPQRVFFLPTREDKVAQISALNLDWFIDDLPEVFNAKHFPKKVGKILFVNDGEISNPKETYIVKRCWKDIQDKIYP